MVSVKISVISGRITGFLRNVAVGPGLRRHVVAGYSHTGFFDDSAQGIRGRKNTGNYDLSFVRNVFLWI
jgi:hypothetical protein